MSADGPCLRERTDAELTTQIRQIHTDLHGHPGVRRGGSPSWSCAACGSPAIESVNSRIRRAVKARGHFPNEQAALKCVYLAIMSLDPTGAGQRRWSMRWKPALGATARAP